VSGEPAQRKLILYMSMSLDGFAARRDGTMDWLGDAQRHGSHRQRAVTELLGQTGLLVLGRCAAEDMAPAWPGSQSPTGELMNALPKVVFSSTLTRLEWSNARVTARPVEEEIAALKAEPGKDVVVFGGVSFARSLAGHGLIDEYRINVQPVALGDGAEMLHDWLSDAATAEDRAVLQHMLDSVGDGLPLLHGLPEPQPLELVGSTTWADGPITQTYVPRPVKTN
jgi:dihydrofolate reductase